MQMHEKPDPWVEANTNCILIFHNPDIKTEFPKFLDPCLYSLKLNSPFFSTIIAGHIPNEKHSKQGTNKIHEHIYTCVTRKINIYKLKMSKKKNIY